MSDDTTLPICPTCGTAMSWSFWDGHDAAGNWIGGMREHCPNCHERPRHDRPLTEQRNRRVELRMSIFDLAKATGLTSVRVSDVEHGYGEPPTDDEIQAINAALGERR